MTEEVTFIPKSTLQFQKIASPFRNKISLQWLLNINQLLLTSEWDIILPLPELDLQFWKERIPLLTTQQWFQTKEYLAIVEALDHLMWDLKNGQGQKRSKKGYKIILGKYKLTHRQELRVKWCCCDSNNGWRNKNEHNNYLIIVSNLIFLQFWLINISNYMKLIDSFQR